MPSTEATMIATLDAEEFFTLGVRASRANDAAAALTYLKQAVAKAPEHAEAHWLLGAEYASLGMPDRAREALSRAIEIDPLLHTARFQFGLLQLTSGLVVEAEAVWLALDDLPENDPLRLFKQGLLRMVSDDFDAARQLIEQARTTPGLDAALQGDMEMVLQQIVERQSAAPADAAAQAGTADDALAQSHLMLSAYRRGLADKSH